MNKLTHFKEAKSFLRKIISHRRDLLQNNLAQQPADAMVIALFDLEQKAKGIHSFENMMKFICSLQVQQNIYRIIDAGSSEWKEELAALIHRGLILQGKGVPDKQLEMKM